jgi:hypothetical protein
VVQIKGAVLLEFGQPRDLGEPGHLGHVCTGSTLSGPAIEEQDGAILRWRLVRQLESARPQNLVVYRWLADIGHRGLLYLTDVWDTPRAVGPVALPGFAHHAQLSVRDNRLCPRHSCDAGPAPRAGRHRTSARWDGNARARSSVCINCAIMKTAN